MWSMRTAAVTRPAAAQRLRGEDRVADASPALVVAAPAGRRSVVRLAGSALRAADGADTGAHHTCTAFVTAGAVHEAWLAGETSEMDAARGCGWKQHWLTSASSSE